MDMQATPQAPQKITILGASKHNNLLVQVGNEQREVSTDPESLKQLLLAVRPRNGVRRSWRRRWMWLYTFLWI